ncbi:putative solute carrier family 35 member f1 protein [Podospora aff. communis PSN243]|uniref:Solute carrier family 35 member f1 protein n=1 Tax=Podospora aff. communis PSN243 TaxID=3040156 RepID=A0AAV9H4T1_9PEZI|nr:putative solute carrier family 35 member f1 protein [Podospora aff. communis PSN243]
MSDGTKPAISEAQKDYGTTAPADNASSPSTNDLTEAEVVEAGLRQLEAKNAHWYSYLLTVDFWVLIAIGQILSLCITGSNTFSTFLAIKGTNIPAFQTIFNYVLLTLIYLPVTIYYHGHRKYFQIVWRDGWKYLILSFLDVEGNYFTVLAYRYTNILSAQLLNFWAIVCVVILSFFLLRVRYKMFQVAGILVCCGGMGVLLASDHLTGVNGGPGVDMVRGDLFGLLGATFYGISNVYEEWFVSKRPVYEVLSFLGVFGIIINGVQAAIFDRSSFQGATWDGAVAGYLVGYTLALTIFYSLVPLMLRMGSAAFFDISLLTANFWGVIIGIRVFGYAIHFMYPIAFVLIIIGLVVYFLAGSVLGDSKKPWLGDNQADGVAGIGTAKLKALNEAKKARLAGEGQA